MVVFLFYPNFPTKQSSPPPPENTLKQAHKWLQTFMIPQIGKLGSLRNLDDPRSWSYLHLLGAPNIADVAGVVLGVIALIGRHWAGKWSSKNLYWDQGGCSRTQKIVEIGWIRVLHEFWYNPGMFFSSFFPPSGTSGTWNPRHFTSSKGVHSEHPKRRRLGSMELFLSVGIPWVAPREVCRKRQLTWFGGFFDLLQLKMTHTFLKNAGP